MSSTVEVLDEPADQLGRGLFALDCLVEQPQTDRASQWTPLASKTSASSSASALTSAVRFLVQKQDRLFQAAPGHIVGHRAGREFLAGLGRSLLASPGRANPAAMRPRSQVNRISVMSSPSSAVEGLRLLHQLCGFSVSGRRDTS